VVRAKAPFTEGAATKGVNGILALGKGQPDIAQQVVVSPRDDHPEFIPFRPGLTPPLHHRFQRL